MSFCICVAYLTALHPQGKNLNVDEFKAVGDMLAASSWELPAATEYKNDLVLPDFLGEAVPKANTNMVAVVVADKRPDPAGPVTPEQWAKLAKMVD